MLLEVGTSFLGSIVVVDSGFIYGDAVNLGGLEGVILGVVFGFGVDAGGEFLNKSLNNSVGVGLAVMAGIGVGLGDC